MSKIIYGDQMFERGEASVLECLTNNDIPVPSSCRSGICQTCLMKAVSGEVPERARQGLSDTLKAQNYFMSCVCYPEGDLAVALAGDALKVAAQVIAVERLASDILCVQLKPADNFDYHAGQFIRLYRDENTYRNYSLATVPGLDEVLCLHVRKVPGGQVSGWMFEHLKSGDIVAISQASGNCFYVPGSPEQALILIGTDSGLAPLYGIVRDALRNSHQADIWLYHGSAQAEGLYLDKPLRELAAQHPQFHYEPCVSGLDVPDGARSGRALDLALADHPSLKGWRVFLCGHPEMVKSGQQKTFLAGASLRAIYADPFV